MDALVARYIAEYAAVMAGPVAADVVDAILAQHLVVDGVYREWLIHAGGGPIGSDWYDRPDELIGSQAKFASECWGIKGFVIGWDGAGNPIVLQKSGAVVVPDHNFGGTDVRAESFAQLLDAGLSAPR